MSGLSENTRDHAADGAERHAAADEEARPRGRNGDTLLHRRSPEDSGEAIRIEAANRWDALDLARRLLAYRTHVVQLSGQRWVVCVRQDSDLDELTAESLDEAGRWVSERQIDTTMHLGDRSYALRP